MRNNQNKRMRGRNNRGHGGGGGGGNNGGNRGHHNPLTRVYESNGPDVKIRGNAHHVAEKYLQLARDASSSGDPVTAENYYQHAEHYLRLIATAQEQFRQQNPNYQAPPAPGEITSDGSFDGEDDDGGQSSQPQFGGHQPQQHHQPQQSQPQPYPRDQQQPAYNPQHQPVRQHQPQPQPSYDGGNGLPSFITGGQPSQHSAPQHTGETANAQPRDAGAVDANGQPTGDRFPRRRRRHPRGARPEMAGADAPGELAGNE